MVKSWKEYSVTARQGLLTLLSEKSVCFRQINQIYLKWCPWDLNGLGQTFILYREQKDECCILVF